jgi:O-antigen/teichoic acid export membrane protein
MLVLAAAVVNLGDYSADAEMAVYLVGIGVAVENLGLTWHSVFTAYERLEMISISLVVQRTLTAAVGIVLLLSGSGLVTVSLVYMGGAFVGLLVSNQVLRRFVVAPRWSLDRSRWVPLIKAGLPIGLASLLFAVLLRIDATLLGLMTGGEDNSEVGVYGAAFRLIEATLFLSWAFSASTLPWLARREDPDAVARGFELGAKAMTAILMPIALCYVLLAPQVIDLLYGQAYDDAVLPLQLLGLMTVLYGLNLLTATVLISRDRPQEFTRIVAAVAVVNLALNLLMIPRYGADATAFNAALSGLLLAVLGVRLIARSVGALRPLRAFAAPIVGGCAMASVVLPTNLPLVPAAALGIAVYLAAVLLFERFVYPEDFGRLRAALPLPARPRTTRHRDVG